MTNTYLLNNKKQEIKIVFYKLKLIYYELEK